jgi:hypothetical protein
MFKERENTSNSIILVMRRGRCAGFIIHDAARDRRRRDKDPIKLSPQWGESDDHVFSPRRNPTRPRILARVEASGSLLHQFFASPPRMR